MNFLQISAAVVGVSLSPTDGAQVLYIYYRILTGPSSFLEAHSP